VSRHFGVSYSTVKEVLSHELGFRKYAGRWVPQLLDDARTNHRRASAIELLELLRGRKAYNFNGIATGDESWFHYHYEQGEMFAASREKRTPFVRTQLEVQKVMITVFFTSTTLIVSEALPNGGKFNQNFFHSHCAPCDSPGGRADQVTFPPRSQELHLVQARELIFNVGNLLNLPGASSTQRDGILQRPISSLDSGMRRR
jgi:hypothetical protein